MDIKATAEKIERIERIIAEESAYNAMYEVLAALDVDATEYTRSIMVAALRASQQKGRDVIAAKILSDVQFQAAKRI
jgi:hypothetical protein